MAERFKLRRKRIGSSQQHQPANRVNKFLSQAIEARSVDQEKAAHVNMFSLCFRDPEKERQVSYKITALCCTVGINISCGQVVRDFEREAKV